MSINETMNQFQEYLTRKADELNKSIKVDQYREWPAFRNAVLEQIKVMKDYNEETDPDSHFKASLTIEKLIEANSHLEKVQKVIKYGQEVNDFVLMIDYIENDLKDVWKYKEEVLTLTNRYLEGELTYVEYCQVLKTLDTKHKFSYTGG